MKWLLLLLSSWAAMAAPEVTRGEINGAKFVIAAPDEWQGGLILLAHGYRDEKNPLDAGFETGGDFSKALLERGWMIASSSYRRNGWIIEDAIEDLEALRKHVTMNFGPVKRCIVVGNSMGGLIATLMAEGGAPAAHGAVAIGAYLGNETRDGPHQKLSYKPSAPLLFLTNETELDQPRNYHGKATGAFTALWEVKRPGHCNVSDAEELAAVLAVDRWVDGAAPERDRNATLPPPLRKSTAVASGTGLQGKVTVVSKSWGNFTTSVVAADMEHLGVEIGGELLLEADARKFAVKLASHRSEVPRGQGAAFVTPDGWLAVSINGGNAAGALGIEEGSTLRVSPRIAGDPNGEE